MTYNEIIEEIEHGAQFRVDFKNRTLHLNGKQVEIQDLQIEKVEDLDKWLDKVEDLYDDYKYSRPTKVSMAKERKCKFKALGISELVAECGHSALDNPTSRDVAQAALEIFILGSLINGSFNPEELFAKDWFYQGSDKDLIIRKDWF